MKTEKLKGKGKGPPYKKVDLLDHSFRSCLRVVYRKGQTHAQIQAITFS